MQGLLTGQRVLITQADEFMGPMFCEVFAQQGAEVIADRRALSATDAAAAVIRDAGDIDVLVANLSIRAPSTPAADVDESEWRDVFAALVDPLPRLLRGLRRR
jgi:2-keto-3-deoxy-L-fuconate dehydrogenase